MTSSGHKRSDSSDHSIQLNLFREMKSDVFKKYEVVQLLGTGSMGSVSKVRIRDDQIGGSAFNQQDNGILGLGVFRRHKRTGSLEKISRDHLFALKSIQIDRVSPLFLEELKNEITILRSMDHPNIVKAHEVFASRRQIYLVMELCEGGDLYARSPYSERDSARIVDDILSAVHYMHNHNIVHRDLKFENIMFESTHPNAEIKIIDFGLSKKFLGPPGIMTDRVGTVYTMAPQVLQGVYSSKADLWSVGVIAFMLLSSTKPFYHKRRSRMIDMIMRGAYNFSASTWSNISEEAKDFVSKLLVVDPKLRMDAGEALKHKWIVNRMHLPDEVPSEELLSEVDDSFLSFRQTSALKKLALTVIAHRSTNREIQSLRNVFDKYDTEKDGVLTYNEFRDALKEHNMPEEDVKEIFSSIDLNQNGQIMYTEFLAATIEAHGRIEEDRIAEAFDRLDSDNTGYITKEDLRDVLGKECTRDQIDAIIKEVDTDKDGRISYSEFLNAFRTQTRAMADQVAKLPDESAHSSEAGLLGPDAKIPGGRGHISRNSSFEK